MGVREDCLSTAGFAVAGLPLVDRRVPIEAALAGLPRLRSGLSREIDSGVAWKKAAEKARSRVLSAIAAQDTEVRSALKDIAFNEKLLRRSTHYSASGGIFSTGLRREMPVVLNHETRGHMQDDLARYLYCAVYGAAHGRSPTSSDFPQRLRPDHKNWESGSFADRFRVQVRGRPSSTVTSHLSKDGHAFVHWDPTQLRSLTVREAARLQTFPDDYVFLGNRTQQFVQVGNAVPPLIAKGIAKVVHEMLSATRMARRRVDAA
jgi:DNA (cytosine-5)-methyltransferase 1